MATLLQIRTRAIRRALADASAGAAATEADNIINDVYKDIVSKAGLNILTQTLALASGDDSYVLTTALADDFNGLHGLYFSSPTQGTGYLEPVDLNTIIQQRAAITNTGIPQMYALVGQSQLELFPAPQGTGATLVVWFYSFDTADRLVTDGNVPTLVPDEYHDVIELAAAYRLAGINESAGENKNLAGELFALYQQRLGELRAYMRRHESKQPRRMKAGYPGRVRTRPAVPSQDLGGRW